MEIDARLVCTLQVMLAEEQAVAALEATRIKRLQHTLLRPEGHSPVLIRDRKEPAQIASPTSHVKHPQRSALIRLPSAKMLSKPGRT